MKLKILFIDCSQNTQLLHPQHILAPLDIGYCISLLENKGHEASFLDLRLKDYNFSKIISIIKKENPDLLLIKPGYHSIGLAKKIAGASKESVSNIFCYGPLATLSPGLFIGKTTGIDLCILGDIEYTILELSDKISNNESTCDVIGTAYFLNHIVRKERSLISSLDKLPFPRQELFFDKGYSFYYPVNMLGRARPGFVISSRGCPHNCSFCSILERVSYGKKYMARSAANVVDELEYMEKLGYNVIYFIDDNFGVDRKRVVDICKIIISKGLHKKMKFIAQARIDGLDDGLVKNMKNAGFSTLCLGIESGSDKILKRINKSITREKIIHVMRLLKKHGIWSVGYFIIGNPGEEQSDVLKSMKLVRIIMPEMLQLHSFKIYSDSPISKQYKLDTYLDPYEICSSANLSQIPLKRLARLNIQLYKKYYFSFNYLFYVIPRILPYYLVNSRFSFKFVLKSLRFLFSGKKDYDYSKNIGYDIYFKEIHPCVIVKQKCKPIKHIKNLRLLKSFKESNSKISSMPDLKWNTKEVSRPIK